MKKGYIALLGILMVSGLVVSSNYVKPTMLKEVENKTLKCYINAEYKTIKPSMIKGFNEETNTWVLVNGYVSHKNCEVY